MKPLPLFEIKNDVYITLNKITEPIAVEKILLFKDSTRITEAERR